MTFAPAFRQCAMVGIEAVMRASEVTLPSLTGTLRSARMKTRLLLRSRSTRRLTLAMRDAPGKCRNLPLKRCPQAALGWRIPAYFATCLTKRSMLQV